jgi:undecaprenyl-diphosphatase
LDGWQAAVLGLIQGATEFLPVSSSGHLVLLEHVWRLPESARVPLTVALHLGTAAAVVVFFARRVSSILSGAFSPAADVRSQSLRTIGMVSAATLPAVVVGIALGDALDRAFSSPALVAISLIGTGGVLFGTRFARAAGRTLGWRVALAVGLAQAVAVLPGVSRSGATIAAGLYAGLSGDEAFEFSFLLAVPAVLGAAGLELPGFVRSGLDPVSAALGAAVAFASGLLAIWVLRKAVAGKRFWLFSVYCWAAGLAALLFVR